MTTSAGGYVFDLDKRFEPGALPATLVYRGNVAAGLLLMAFAVVWTAVVLAICGPVFAEPLPVSLLPIPFALVGAGLFVVGLRGALMRISVTLEKEAATIVRRRWFRSRTVSVPFADFPGVLRVRVDYSRNKSPVTAWLAVLPQDDRDRSVVMAATRDEAEGRRLVEDYATWLGVPALEEDVDGFQARAPGDLDKPVAVLAAEGKLASAYRPDRAPPAEIEVEAGGDRIVVGMKKGALPLWFGAVIAGAAAAGAFGFIGWGGSDAARVIGGAVGMIVLAVVLWLVFRSLTTRRQIVLTRERLAIVTLEPGAAAPRVDHDMALSEIEAIRVARAPYGGLALWFDTDRGSFHIGDRMPRRALDHVRDLVVAALATARGERGGEAS